MIWKCVVQLIHDLNVNIDNKFDATLRVHLLISFNMLPNAYKLEYKLSTEKSDNQKKPSKYLEKKINVV